MGIAGVAVIKLAIRRPTVTWCCAAEAWKRSVSGGQAQKADLHLPAGEQQRPSAQAPIPGPHRPLVAGVCELDCSAELQEISDTSPRLEKSRPPRRYILSGMYTETKIKLKDGR